MQWKKLIRDKARKEPGFKKKQSSELLWQNCGSLFLICQFSHDSVSMFCTRQVITTVSENRQKSTKNRKNLIFQIFEKKLPIFVMIFLRRPISRLFIGQFQARNLNTCFEILSSAEFLPITILNECRGKSSFSILTNYFVGPLLYLIRP